MFLFEVTNSQTVCYKINMLYIIRCSFLLLSVLILLTGNMIWTCKNILMTKINYVYVQVNNCQLVQNKYICIPNSLFVFVSFCVNIVDR